jgi:alpha-tubulin suppressor-like RCC1 family protein
LAWGNNVSGQLGDGTTAPRPSPVLVRDPSDPSGLLTDVVAIAAGGSHSLALKSTGAVFAWGLNVSGQLGDNTTALRTLPVRVTLPSDPLGYLHAVTAIAAGGSHSVAIRTDGTAWAWGNNVSGQVGDGTTTQRNVPTAVTALSGVAAIAAGGAHTLALQAGGSVWAWGNNASGQLGDTTTSTRSTPARVLNPLSPDGFLGAVTSITAGTSHSLALEDSGTLWSWGLNSSGQIGDGTTVQRTAPVHVQAVGIAGVTAIAADGSHNVALTQTGLVAAWGGNLLGELGNGDYDGEMLPVGVTGVGSAVALAAGGSHTLALQPDGTVWAWGNNANGQLGDGTLAGPTPVKVRDPLDPSGFLTGVVVVAAGGSHSLALTSSFTVVAWGNNAAGQLGDGTTTERTEPVRVKDPSDPTGWLTGVVALAAGGSHSLALRSDGTVVAWGNNAFGQLGDATTTQRQTPVPVKDPSSPTGWLESVTAIAAGGSHSLARKADQTVSAWGANTSRQIGDGTTAQRTTPVQVKDSTDPSGFLTGATAISAGSNHSLALRFDGTVRDWGSNAASMASPVIDSSDPSGVLSGVVAIAAGGSHNLALKSDWTARAWGLNTFGQLGVATIAGFDSPPVAVRDVPGTGRLSAITAIAAGVSHSVASIDTTSPLLTTPGSIVVAAASSSGSIVSFNVTASDPDDAAGPVSCSPVSGSLFPLGTTSVSCSSTDAHGNTGTAAFTVTVVSPTQTTSNLISAAAAVSFQQASQLLQSALRNLNAGNVGTACSHLGAFINQVQAQSGKQLTASEASQLTGPAIDARTALGCR